LLWLYGSLIKAHSRSPAVIFAFVIHAPRLQVDTAFNCNCNCSLQLQPSTAVFNCSLQLQPSTATAAFNCSLQLQPSIAPFDCSLQLQLQLQLTLLPTAYSLQKQLQPPEEVVHGALHVPVESAEKLRMAASRAVHEPLCGKQQVATTSARTPHKQITRRGAQLQIDALATIQNTLALSSQILVVWP
jgi:hypothetical protein